ncbi:unnamed protein product, partial [Prorocentrum cordatum]
DRRGGAGGGEELTAEGLWEAKVVEGPTLRNGDPQWQARARPPARGGGSRVQGGRGRCASGAPFAPPKTRRAKTRGSSTRPAGTVACRRSASWRRS